MKRKLICVIFMLTGMAALAAAILLSRGRSEYIDPSPVYTLIFLSVAVIAAAALYLNSALEEHAASKLSEFFMWVFRVVIVIVMLACLVFTSVVLFSATNIYIPLFLFISATAAAAWFRYAKDEPDQIELSKREAMFMRAFRVLGILAVLVCLAFIIIMWFLTRSYTNWMRNIFPLMILAAAGIGAAMLSLKVRPPIIKWDIIKGAAALVITAALLFVYLNYMPKYSQDDGINILRSKMEFAQKDVFTVYYPFVSEGSFPRQPEDAKSLGDNPFYEELYSFSCDSYGYDADGLHIMKGYIHFDPANGGYVYMRAQSQDKTLSNGEWPEPSYYFMYDKDGQHRAVLNLFFRKMWSDNEASVTDQRFFAGSGEWDAKIKDVMYPHNFPEDEARAFLKSIAEETLKTKLAEQINILGTYTLQIIEDKPVEVYFYGIDIATYQNGEIVLKL